MYGVYIEFTYKKDDTVSSFLFIPEYVKKTKDPRKETVAVPSTFMYRTVSSENKQKSYRFAKGEPSNSALLGAWGDSTTLSLQVLAQLDILDSQVFQSVESYPESSIERDPFLLEITDVELESIEEEVTPRALTSRLYRARLAAGYPALPGKE